MKIALVSPKAPLYRHKGGIFSKRLRYQPLTLTTLAVLIPADLDAEVELMDEGIEDIDINLDGLFDREIIALVNHALARGLEKCAEVGVIGLSPMNPHCLLPEKHFSAVSYHSRIETVSWPEHPLPELDTRPPQPEVALL